MKCGGVIQTCLEAKLDPRITGQIVTDALRWRPDVSVSPGCKGAITAFDKAVDKHEAHHYSDAKNILAAARKDPPHKITGCGASYEEARAKLKAAAKHYQEQRLAYYLHEYSKSIDKFHASAEGSPINMNCGGC